MQALRAKMWWRRNAEISTAGWEILNHLVNVGGEAVLNYSYTMEVLVTKELIEPYEVVKVHGRLKVVKVKITEKGFLVSEERAFLNGQF